MFKSNKRLKVLLLKSKILIPPLKLNNYPLAALKMRSSWRNLSKKSLCNLYCKVKHTFTLLIPRNWLNKMPNIWSSVSNMCSLRLLFCSIKLRTQSKTRYFPMFRLSSLTSSLKLVSLLRDQFPWTKKTLLDMKRNALSMSSSKEMDLMLNLTSKSSKKWCSWSQRSTSILKMKMVLMTRNSQPCNLSNFLPKSILELKIYPETLSRIIGINWQLKDKEMEIWVKVFKPSNYLVLRICKQLSLA